MRKKKVNTGFMRKISYLAPRVGALGSAFTSAAEPPRLPGAARCARRSARMQAAHPSSRSCEATDNPDRTPCPVPYLLPLLTWLRCNRSPNLCSKLACMLRSRLCTGLLQTLHCPAPCLSPRPRRGVTARARCAQCASCGWSPCRLRWRMDEQNFLCGPINTHH